MKNYHFERDLQRKIDKMKRDVEVCSLYAATQNVSEVAKRLEMGRNTVTKIISEHYSIENGVALVKFNLSAELPKITHGQEAEAD